MVLLSLSLLCLSQNAFRLGSPSAAGSVRADVWQKDLPEAGVKDPKNGRRVHIVLDSVDAVPDNQLKSVMVNGQEGIGLANNDDITYLDWFRAHGNTGTGSLWISFHTHNTDWLGSSVDVKAIGQNGTVFEGSVSLGSSDNTLSISYVVFRSDGSEALVHLHNTDTSSTHKATALTFDGKSVPVPASAASIPPGGHVIISVPCAKQSGDVWTASLTVDAAVGNPLGFGGRADTNERFPVIAWPHSSDCPLPGANDDNAKELQKDGMDSVYYDGGSFSKNCKANMAEIVNKFSSNSSTTFHVLTDHGTAAAINPEARANFVDAVFIGDEADGSVDASHLRKPLSKVMESISAVPKVPTYQGSKTTRNVGSFAGITDIQGSDAYCAACAPTMLGALFKLPLSYPYDYLRNARDNHAPLPFWGYAQLYSDAWSYQANANELIVQLGQLVLSGSKALMFFQFYEAQIKEHKMKQIAEVIRSIRAVGKVIKEGDIGGLSHSVKVEPAKNALVEVIRSPEQVLVVLVNMNARGYSNLVCHTQILDRHWTFDSQNVDKVTLDLSSGPDVSSLTNWQEAVDGRLTPITDIKIKESGSSVEISDVEISGDIPVRLLVADVKASP